MLTFFIATISLYSTICGIMYLRALYTAKKQLTFKDIYYSACKDELVHLTQRQRAWMQMSQITLNEMLYLCFCFAVVKLKSVKDIL